MSVWAKPCTNWEKGSCLKGINCWYKHPGFPVTENRCSNCGTKGHMYKECKAPGGGKDIGYQKNKDAYNARKAKAESDLKGKGSDKDKKGKGKGKGDDKKDKGKGKGAGKTAMDHWEQKNDGARAAVDQEIARASAAGGTKAHFPRQGIGLDSWANVHLIHQKARHCLYTDTLSLAHGGTKCHRETGRKGVPIVKVPWIKDGDNIDLFRRTFF